MRIAVSCEMNFAQQPQKYRALCNMDYIEFVNKAGAHPFLVVSGMDAGAIADSMDGLLLTGGKDINPLIYNDDLKYNGATSCNIVRDLFERDLYNAFASRGKPIFGICRGFQLIGVLQRNENLRLVQDIHQYKDVSLEHNQGSKEICGTNPVHTMMCRGAMKYLMGDKVPINSFHHQGFFMVGKVHRYGWLRNSEEVIGWSRSNDKAKVLEGILLKLEADNNEGYHLVGGVQYHPERMVRSQYGLEVHLKPFQFVMGMLEEEDYDFENFIEQDEQVAQIEETETTASHT